MEKVEEKSLGYEEVAILGVKNEFFIKTGRHIRVEECTERESKANFTTHARIDQIIKMVFDFTGWTWNTTYLPPSNGERRRGGDRSVEKAYRRGMIDYIAMNNGCTLIECSRFTDRGDHTSIIWSLKKFEDMLDTEIHVRQSLDQTVAFCRGNFYLYKDKTFTKEQIISEELKES